jgi:hypothetical protein
LQLYRWREKSFADDLAVRRSPVSSRVALLLRSAEGKLHFARFFHGAPLPCARTWRKVKWVEGSLPRSGWAMGEIISIFCLWNFFFFVFIFLFIFLSKDFSRRGAWEFLNLWKKKIIEENWDGKWIF